MFIVTKKIDSENISKVCRTCLREDNDKMICLFIGPPESSLGAKLQSLSYLEVSQGDGLPEKMCDRCVTRAESALLFREQCRAADQALRQAALQLSKDQADANYSKSYHQNQVYTPLQCPQNSSRLSDYHTYSNYQDFYIHNQFHPPIYQREEHAPQHMHIIESPNTYFSLSRYNSSFINNEIFTDRTYPILRTDDFNSFMSHESMNSRTSCALQCSICNYTFNNEAQLAYHSITYHTDNVDLSSDEVNIEVEEISNTNISIQQGKSLEPPIENNKVNSICNSQFQNLNYAQDSYESEKITSTSVPPQDKNITTSLISEIIRNNKFKCDVCSRLFSQQSKLEMHQASHNRKKLFNCAHCSKSYSSKSKLAAHTRLHTQTNIHKCNICQKIFSWPSYLNEHMKTHNPESQEKKVTFECAECKKLFHCVKSYRKHTKFHTGKGLFQCDICDKLFSQKYSLKVHMSSHRLFKSHKCELCDKSFNQRSNLVEHMRIHTKVKPFKCTICDKGFSQSSHLKSHELSHNSIRKFQCKVCGKRFKLSSHLKRHANLHTGKKMYKCDQCNQTFSQAFSLKRHSKKHTESM
ncbi:zinc finger protein 28-like [Phymastichus coffea]|uniref:zinc finger protein 28-like n=1 Tax=Phymastichus coffea TaxID=108790 RepID=UPI00273CBC1E|nr:zinc finger protein 28-like [Phymastichus coffea]